jgi:N-acetyl-anhydromuramyl-L-alanine amidase AmpD
VKASDIVAAMPPEPGHAREQDIYRAVFSGSYVLPWSSINSEWKGRRARIRVSSDCLRIGEPGDFMRVSVSANTAQLIADLLHATLPTTKICDLVWQQADVHVEPCLFGEPRAATSRMLDYDRAVEAKVAGRTGLVEVVGKHWVITNGLLSHPGKVGNYGFYSPNAPYRSASGFRMWQTLGFAHDANHVDYSQVLRLVSPVIEVDGAERSFAELACDELLSGLISSEGILRTLRIPDGIGPTEPEASAPPSLEELGRVAVPLNRGMQDEDVRVWQRFVRTRPDGSFGPLTEAATKAFEAAVGLPKTGIVSLAVLEKALEELERREKSTTAGRIPIDKFVQARNYTKAARSEPADVHWIVLHTMEAPEKGTTAEAVAEYFRTTTVQASAHFCVDNDSIVQCVRLQDIAWAAPGANKYGVQIEQAGYARQSETEWEDPYSQAMLGRSAALAAQHIQPVFKIPTQYIDAEHLKVAQTFIDAGQPVPDSLRGVTTHNDVTLAFRKSTHTDPGPHFPMADYLERMRRS